MGGARNGEDMNGEERDDKAKQIERKYKKGAFFFAKRDKQKEQFAYASN